MASAMASLFSGINSAGHVFYTGTMIWGWCDIFLKKLKLKWEFEMKMDANMNECGMVSF